MSTAIASPDTRFDRAQPVQPDRTNPTAPEPVVLPTQEQVLAGQNTALSQAIDPPTPFQQNVDRPSRIQGLVTEPSTEQRLLMQPGIGDLYASNRLGGKPPTGVSNVPPGTSQINLNRPVGVPGRPDLGEVYLHQRVGPQGDQFFAQARNGMYPLRATNLNDAVTEARGHLSSGRFPQPFTRLGTPQAEFRQPAIFQSNPDSAAAAKLHGFTVMDGNRIFIENTYEGGVRYSRYFGAGGATGTQSVAMPAYASPEFRRAVNEWNNNQSRQAVQDAVSAGARMASRRSAQPPVTASPNVPVLQGTAPPNGPGGPPTVNPAGGGPRTANPATRPNPAQPSGITSQNPYQIESRAPGGPTSRTTRGNVTSQGPGSDLVVGTAGPRQLSQPQVDAFVAQLNSPQANRTYTLGGLSIETNYRGQPLQLTSSNIRLVGENRDNRTQRGIGWGWDGSGRGVGSHLLNARWAPGSWSVATPTTRLTVVPQSYGYNNELKGNFEATVDRLASTPGNRVDVRTTLFYEPDGVTLRNLVHEYRVNGGPWTAEPRVNR